MGMFYFDIRALIADCGGPSVVARVTGTTRPAIYGWINRGRMASKHIARLKGEFPSIDLNGYVKWREPER